MKLIPKNWESFQHYKNRKPPWIKLYRDLLDDADFIRLPVASRALAPLLWLLASEKEDGVFEASANQLVFRLRLPEKEVKEGLKPLIDKGFFIVADSMLASCLQDATPETETEGEGEGEDSAEPQSDSTPAIIQIPLIGKAEFGVSQQQIDEWQSTYPVVDVLQKLKEMRQWCLANPERKKTRNGVRAFIIRWLGKEQDKGYAKPNAAKENNWEAAI
jgi:hypothetical protein